MNNHVIAIHNQYIWNKICMEMRAYFIMHGENDFVGSTTRFVIIATRDQHCWGDNFTPCNDINCCLNNYSCPTNNWNFYHEKSALLRLYNLLLRQHSHFSRAFRYVVPVCSGRYCTAAHLCQFNMVTLKISSSVCLMVSRADDEQLKKW